MSASADLSSAASVPSVVPQVLAPPLLAELPDDRLGFDMSLQPVSKVSPRNWTKLSVAAGLVILVIAVAGVFVWRHQKVTNLQHQVSGLNTQINTVKKQTAGQNSDASAMSSGAGSTQQSSRNATRETYVQSLQTQFEAFFSQNGYYPSLTDLNSASWRAANMKSLDPNALVDPSSTCNPAAGCVVSAPAAKAIAYQVSDSTGMSCETDDTSCSKYTLTATYEGTVDGAATYVKKNLD